MATVLDLITDSLRELRVINATDAPASEDADLGLRRLNLIVDDWNAQREAIYAETFSTFVLVPATQPHLIGPSGTTGWDTVTQRPVAISRASLIIGTARYPIAVRDRTWYAGLYDPELTGAQPSDLWYEPDWPNGKCYFYPVPSSAYSVELLLRTILAPFTLAATLSMPPGYEHGLMLTLAEQLAPSFGQAAQLTPQTVREASRLRAVIQMNNKPDVHISTVDAGMPQAGGGRRGDYRTGRSI